MKSHLLLLQVVLDDMGTRCCTCTSRDLKTITARYQREGLSFLTIVLPAFCKDFEKSLSSEHVDSTSFAGFAKKGCLPKFLSGFTSQVFDIHSGVLLDEPSIDAIYAVRQITLLLAKINYPCNQTRVDAALKKFIKCEQDVREADARLHSDDMSDFRRISVLLWDDVFRKVDENVYHRRIVPKHGPGATADRLSRNRKYEQTTWTRRLEEGHFPYGEFLFPNWRYFSSDIDILEPGAEIPVRVITVPKTQKTPRIIAIEPTCMQYTQQAILEDLLKAIGEHDYLPYLIGFDDQIPNQEMALKGSLHGDLATLDLSEASDRVSNQHVRNLLAYRRNLSEAVDACRSRKADVPGYGVIRLAKYASMGSALCFPFEAMVFLTVIFLGIERELCTPMTDKTIRSFIGRVRVYGDDIIIPVDYVRSVTQLLQTFGFVVNADKSFWTGKFRESCGKEYFDGEDVSIVRVREALPRSRKHAREVISTVSLRNQMYFAGNWKTARFLDEWLERLIPFPLVHPRSPALGRHSHFTSYDEEKLCKYLHTSLVRAYVVKARIPESNLDGPAALQKWLLKRGDEPFADSKHLERAGRPVAVSIKLQWVPSV